jgi:hypothetical protein
MVVFPLPDNPTIPTLSLGFIVKDKFFNINSLGLVG